MLLIEKDILLSKVNINEHIQAIQLYDYFGSWRLPEIYRCLTLYRRIRPVYALTSAKIYIN